MRHPLEPDPALRPEHLKTEAGPGRGHRPQIPRHARLHPKEDRRRVVGIDRDDPPEALAEHLGDRAAQIDHPVHGVDAHRRQPAARRLLAVRAPRVRLQRQRIGKRHGRFDVEDRAEIPRADALAQRHHFRVKAAVVAQAERDARLLGRRHRRRRVGRRQRERLFTEDVFPRRRGRHDLRAMQRMRRGQHHRLDRRVGQQRGVIGREPQLLRRRKRLHLRGDRPRRARHEVERRDCRAAPPRPASSPTTPAPQSPR